jgi:hypothetical protein
MYFTYSSGSYALELNDHGAIGWGASYNGNLTEGNFGNTGQVLTSAGANSPPTWNNFSTIANGTSNINIASANSNVTITANAETYTFGTDSTLTLPGGSKLRPLGSNLDIFAGTGSYVNLITSDESSYMGVGGAGGYITTAGGTWDFNTNGNLTLPSSGYLRVATGIVGTGASPAPTLSGFSSVSAINISASGNVTANTITSNKSLTLAVYADNTARDAAIPTPTAGMLIFNTAAANFQGYNGSWGNLTLS